MPAKPESRFWKRLKKQLPEGHIVRVENPANPGTPDVNMCVQGVECWPELKQVKSLPKRPETPVFTGCLKPEQVLWHKLRSRAGGKSYIIGYVEESDKFYVIPGSLAPEFNSMTLKELETHNLPLDALWKPS